MAKKRSAGKSAVRAASLAKALKPSPAQIAARKAGAIRLKAAAAARRKPARVARPAGALALPARVLPSKRVAARKVRRAGRVTTETGGTAPRPQSHSSDLLW